jgi:hypothetical protein
VTDHDELDFSHKAQTGEVDNSLIAEPFNEDVWKEILK